jgi:NADH:ubiquinone oxidoreductase subunit E
MNIEEDIDTEKVFQIIRRYNNERSSLIAILQEVQAEWGYLPEKVLRTISKELDCSLVDVYGVATFYHSFRLAPKGKHNICICLGTACHIRGAAKVVEEFERQLGIKPGMTTDNKNFTLETVNCLGACALGPVVVIDDKYYSKVKKSIVANLIEETLRKGDVSSIEKEKRSIPIVAKCPYCNNSLMDDKYLIEGYPSVKIGYSINSKSGFLNLSSLYGSNNGSVEINIPSGIAEKYFCPHCAANLHDVLACSFCRAPMIAMLIDGGGKIQICPRKGCKNNILELDQSKTIISNSSYKETE